MGGRGAGSGLNKASSEQQRRMRSLESRNALNPSMYTAPTFKMNKDGSVSYEYVTTTVYQHVHGGKMQSQSKNDPYERTTTESGVIMQDGLVKKNKPVKVERLIKKGH